MIAAEKRPLAGGEASSEQTAIPPADSPAIVTLDGLPSKAGMLACVHLSAASMSSRLKFPVGSALDRPGNERMPNGPSR